MYSYVGNNPVNYVDPTGHYPWGINSKLFEATIKIAGFVKDMVSAYTVNQQMKSQAYINAGEHVVETAEEAYEKTMDLTDGPIYENYTVSEDGSKSGSAIYIDRVETYYNTQEAAQFSDTINDMHIGEALTSGAMSLKNLKPIDGKLYIQVSEMAIITIPAIMAATAEAGAISLAEREGRGIIVTTTINYKNPEKSTVSYSPQ